jgi:phospholipid/cholesterol/gamma-HCH transport system substrate-binding protein
MSVEARAGVAACIVVLGLAFLAMRTAPFAGFDAGASYPLRARFDNVGGLRLHASVRSAGVSIGQVTAISMDAASHRALVVMEIRKGLVFPVDSTASILTEGLLGESYVGLEPGSSPTTLEPGAVIARSRSALVLESVIDRLLPANSGSSPSAAASRWTGR